MWPLRRQERLFKKKKKKKVSFLSQLIRVEIKDKRVGRVHQVSQPLTVPICFTVYIILAAEVVLRTSFDWPSPLLIFAVGRLKSSPTESLDLRVRKGVGSLKVRK